MADSGDFQVILRAILDQQSKVNIITQINELTKTLKPIGLNLNFDKSIIDRLTSSMSELAQTASTVKFNADGTEKIKRDVQVIKDEMGNVTRITKEYKAGTEDIASVTTQMTTNYEKQTQSLEKQKKLTSEISSFNISMNSKMTSLVGKKDVDPTSFNALLGKINGITIGTEDAKLKMRELRIEFEALDRTSKKFAPLGDKKLSTEIDSFKLNFKSMLDVLSQNRMINPKGLDDLKNSIKSLTINTPDAGVAMKNLGIQMKNLERASKIPTSYEKNLATITKEARLGIMPLDAYIKKMKEVMHNKSGDIYGGFTNMSDKSQLLYNDKLSQAIAEQTNNQKKLYSEQFKRGQLIANEINAVQKLSLTYQKMNDNVTRKEGKYGSAINPQEQQRIQSLLSEYQKLNLVTQEGKQRASEIGYSVSQYTKTLAENGRQMATNQSAQERLNFSISEFKKLQTSRLDSLIVKGADSASISKFKSDLQQLSSGSKTANQDMTKLRNDITLFGRALTQQTTQQKELYAEQFKRGQLMANEINSAQKLALTYQKMNDNIKGKETKFASAINPQEQQRIQGLLAEYQKLNFATTEGKQRASEIGYAVSQYTKILAENGRQANTTQVSQERLNFAMQEFKKMQISKLDGLSTKGVNSDEIEKLRVRLLALNSTMPNARQEMARLRNDITLLGKTSQVTGKAFRNFVGMALGITSVFSVFMIGRRAITSMLSEVRKLDDSLLELRKVTSLTGNELEQFTKLAYNSAEGLSRTGRELVDATATMVKAGVTLEEGAMQYGKLALSMANVGDGMEDVANNANVLISTMKGYSNETTAFAQNILNIFNEVSNKSAITFSDIAEGVTRTSAVYNQAEVPIEKLVGLLVGSNEILMNIEKSSTGLITISQRLRQVTSAFEEDPENISKLDKAFREIAGIDIRDANGQIKDTFSILESLQKIYPTLTKNQQQYLGELTAGKRQINVLQSVLSNWKSIEETVKTATNSEGSYEREQLAYFDSISGKLKMLQSAWQQLSVETFNSGLVKSILDLTTGIVKLITVCGGLIPVLISLGVAFAVFKFAPIVNGIATLAIGLANLIPALSIATGGVIALNTALSFSIAGVAVVAIMGLAYALNYMSKDMERLQSKVAELTTKLSGLTSEIQELNDLEYKTDEQEKQLNLLEREFIARQKLLDITERQLAQKQTGQIDVNMSSFLSGGKSTNLSNGDLGKSIMYGTETQTSITNLKKLREEELAYIGTKEESGKKHNELLDKIEEEEKKLLTNRIKLSEITEILKDNYDKLEPSQQKQVDQAIKMAEATINTVDNMSDILGVSDIIAKNRTPLTNILQTQESNPQYIIDYEEEAKKLDISVADLKTSLVVLGLEFENNNKIIDESVAKLGSYERVIEDIANANDEVIDGSKDLSSAIEKLKDEEKLSGEEILKLIQTYPELRKSLTETNGVYELSLESLELIRKATIDKQIETINSEITSTQAVLQGTSARLKAQGIELEGILSIGTARRELNRLESQTLGMAGQNERMPLNPKDEARAEILRNEIKTVEDAKKALESLENLKQDLLVATSDNGEIEKPKAKSYLNQGYADIIEEIENKRQSIVNEIEKTESAMELALTTGDTKVYDEHKSNLESLYEAELLVIKEASPRLIAEREKLATELSSTGYFKGIVSDLTDLDLEKALRTIDAQIADADESQAESLGLTKSKMEELGSAIISMNSSISGYENDAFKSQTESAERYLETIQKIADKAISLADDEISTIERKQSLLEDDSTAYLTLEQDKYDELASKQEAYMTQYNTITKGKFSTESEEAIKIKDLWYDTESEMISMKKDMVQKAIAIRQSEYTGLNSYRDKVVEMLTSQHELEKKAIQKTMDALKEKEKVEKGIVDKRKEELSKVKEQYEYEKKINALRQSIQNITSDLAGMSRDTSAEGIIRRIELEEQLSAEQENLKDATMDESIKRQEEILNQMSEAITKNYEQQYAQMQAQIDAEVDYKKKADEMIANDNGTLLAQMIAWNKEYGSGIDADITKIWEGAKAVLTEYDVAQQGVLATLNQIATAMLQIENSGKSLSGMNFDGTKLLQSDVKVDPNKVNNFMNEKVPLQIPTSGFVNTPVATTNNNQNITIDATTQILVDGNADKTTLLSVEKMLQQQLKNINDSLKKVGIGRNALNITI